MNSKLTRRDFLKLSGLSVANLAFRSLYKPQMETGDIARVAIRSVSVYVQPDDTSTILYQRYRDELINIYYELVSDFGPGYNPVWYRVWRGYVHSGHLQCVKYQLNPILTQVPKSGQLVEVTVPFTQTMRRNPYSSTGWDPVYRLYYKSVHWATGIEEGPDGQPWYKLKDELLEVEYHATASHLRFIPAEELTPISANIPPEKKRIEVSIGDQTLTAFEEERVVLKTKISSGGRTPPNLPQGSVPWETPAGTYTIQVKMPSKHMGDGNLTADTNAYELPGVPWVSFFAPHGIAFHGTYWHTDFGIPLSHGCINMRTDEAKWIYCWTTPVASAIDWDRKGSGTRVIVH
jgi:lipoprotein-anchoring transpeptidase ErfK/SrfK